eukprot:g2690.t1
MTSQTTDKRLELGHLEDYLQSELGGVVSDLSVKEFSGGASNPTYLLSSSAGKHVLRSKPRGKLVSSAHAIDREYRIINALGQTDFPVPKTYLYCQDLDVIGAEFYLMEFVAGRVIENFTLPDETISDRAAIYDSMNEVMAKLHAIDPDAIGLSDYGKPGNYFERQINIWLRQYQQQDGQRPRFEDLATWLTENLIQDDQRKIVHGDYRLTNILIAPDQPKVAAVLDWELSTTGHPLADFTYNLSQWYLPTFNKALGWVTLYGADLEKLGIPEMEAYAETYARRVGMEISNKDLYYGIAFNLFRLAGIIIGIIGRAKADDYLHAVQEADNFSESNLFYYAGTTASGKTIGGIIRVANRPNQGYAEATVLYFPGDGSALFKFERPEISGNTSWRVSGWDLDVVKPGGVEFRSAYEGQAFHLSDPKILATPKLAFKEPCRDLKLELQHFGKSPVSEFKYKSDNIDDSMRDIVHTRGLHQLTAFTGSVAIGDAATETVQGYGWRDHNWGPRNWQAFPKHAFYTGNFGDQRGFVLFKTEGGLGYFMHDGPDKLYEVTALDMITNYGPDGRTPVRMRADVTLETGAMHRIEGQCGDFIPLRNRRENMTTHLGYSLWQYQLDGEQKGLGIAEHMSQSEA